MYVLVSVPNEAFHRVMRARALQRKLGIEASVYRNSSELMRNVEKSFGGRLVLLDWSNGKIVADTAVEGASGIAVGQDVIFASSWTANQVQVLQPGRRSCISHPLFNHLHTVELSSRGTLFIASAGADVIVELSLDNQLLWHWYGPEHGFDRPSPSPWVFDPAADYREVRSSTSERAMHVTCALPLDDGRVLATLFHQGQLIVIDRETGGARVVLDGLQRPHAVHRRPGGFLVSDTLGHRILLLDESLGLSGEIPFGSHWLQDTIQTSAGTLLALENVHIDQTPEPGLSNQIVELDPHGRLLRRLSVPADHRLFTAREIDQAAAQWIIQDWGLTHGLDAWAWSS
jgi:hypothetical protein